MPTTNLDRDIIIGLIVNDDVLDALSQEWEVTALQSKTAQMIASWCLSHYKKYGHAPNKEIGSIFERQVKRNLLKDEQKDDIAKILASLSDEYENKDINVQYIIESARQSHATHQLENLSENITVLLEKGQIDKAVEKVHEFDVADMEMIEQLDFSQGAEEAVEKAFAEKAQGLIKYPHALGQFWNAQLVRGGFVALLAPEKRGKSFLLLDMAMRGVRAGNNVAFFQAGDMTQSEQLRRVCIYLAHRSNEERYCEAGYAPILDCWKNQTNDCVEACRECGGELFPKGVNQKDITYDLLLDSRNNATDYEACHNCSKIEGAVYLEYMKQVPVLQQKDAIEVIQKWTTKTGKRLRLVTYPNGTLSVRQIDAILIKWKKKGWVPDVIVIDYADLLVAEDTRLDWRNQQNAIWKRLRRLSQERECLVVTATQAAATSYSKDTITLEDFSDDKRKYAHVTAMYGMNQTPREKKLGILRLNELVIREAAFDSERQIKIIQDLKRGRPVVDSYF